jgi:hypothetical protein
MRSPLVVSPLGLGGVNASLLFNIFVPVVSPLGLGGVNASLLFNICVLGVQIMLF